MDHKFYMNRCIELAQKGTGLTSPNPSVGALLVQKGEIIGEGYTSPYGGNHAEVNAIQSVSDKSLLKESMLYVTLEPCSHFGKTPPCSDLIIQSGIKQVIIGCIDDNPLVGGRGVKKLKENGVEVILGVLETKCKEQLKRFFTFHNKKRPYVILKWAQSLDGFIAPKSKKHKAPVWITSIKSRQLVHQWRAEEHAILVGANTVLEDNPSLTVRHVGGLNPVRIVLDSRGDLKTDFKVFDNRAKTIKLNSDNLNYIIDYLYKEEILSVIIEGGSKTLQLFIDKGEWDEARVFSGIKNLGSGVEAPKLDCRKNCEIKVGSDTLALYKND